MCYVERQNFRKSNLIKFIFNHHSNLYSECVILVLCPNRGRQFRLQIKAIMYFEKKKKMILLLRNYVKHLEGLAKLVLLNGPLAWGEGCDL